jgi:hypothetical protein
MSRPNKQGISGKACARLGNQDGAPVFLLKQQTASGTSSYTVEKPTFRFRVVDVWGIATAGGGAADTITVKNGSAAITAAMDFNVLDTAVVRNTTINDAEHVIEKSDTLTVTTASDAVGLIYILCARDDA